MVRQLKTLQRRAMLAAALSAPVLLAGCSQDSAAPPEPESSKSAAADASGAWNDEKVDAMKKALANRRKDSDSAPSPDGSKPGK